MPEKIRQLGPKTERAGQVLLGKTWDSHQGGESAVGP